MTQECEERLINDMAEVKTLLKEHIDVHKEKRSLIPVWAGIFFSTALGVLAFFGGKNP